MHVFINPIGVYSFLVSQSFNYNSFIFLMSLELDHKLFFILIIFLNYGRKKISMTVLYYQELFLTKIYGGLHCAGCRGYTQNDWAKGPSTRSSQQREGGRRIRWYETLSCNQGARKVRGRMREKRRKPQEYRPLLTCDFTFRVKWHLLDTQSGKYIFTDLHVWQDPGLWRQKQDCRSEERKPPPDQRTQRRF